MLRYLLRAAPISLTLGFAAIAPPVCGAYANPFEPADFNPTQALLERGIDLSKLSELAGSGCSVACSSLKFLYGDEAVETKDEAAYENFTASYWSLIQENVAPQCIFKPSAPEEVSVLVLLSRLTQCPFAVRSGGHAAFAGASSIEGGITVSFMNLKNITLSGDKQIASVQPGNCWGEVYEELAKSDITVIGGRVWDIGVGDLTTGGGISFLSNLYGWACDNVESYDARNVVTARGDIITASVAEHPDLYWALRGGGNNFGLVVNFNYRTVPLPGGKMWGGNRGYTEESWPAVINAFINMISSSAQDPKAGLWVAWYVSSDGAKLASSTLWYTEPDGRDAPIFQDFYAIEAISDTLENVVLAEWAGKIQKSNPTGLRQVYWDLTIKADPEVFSAAVDIFFEEVAAVIDIPGIYPVLLAQGITVPQMDKMRQNGGNALGLDPGDGPLYLLMVANMWQNEQDDDAVYRYTSKVVERITAMAKARGVDNDYIYMSYASQFQDVISSYGADNRARLKSIAEKYDPTRVFQMLQPGYFKLDRAPVSDFGYFFT